MLVTPDIDQIETFLLLRLIAEAERKGGVMMIIDVINLIGSLTARIEVTRVGQQNIDVGDLIIVNGKLCLPAEATIGEFYLLPELRFNNRVELLGEPLSKNWGNVYTPYTHRTKDKRFIAPTWKEAEAKVLKELQDEVEKLRTALINRAQALLDAEK